MAKFDHPNVMKLLGVSISQGRTLLVIMPYMAQGSLLLYLRKKRDELTFDVKESLQLQTQVKKLILLCTVATCSCSMCIDQQWWHQSVVHVLASGKRDGVFIQ